MFEGAERPARARRNHQNVAALLEKAQFLKRDGRSAELLFDQVDRSPNAPCGNPAIRQALQCAEGDEIAKTVETFAPARPGTDQPAAFPNSEDGSVPLPGCGLLLFAYIAATSWRHLSLSISATIMHPLSTGGAISFA